MTKSAPLTHDEAIETSKWIMPSGQYKDKPLAQIRLGHLRYVVNLKRTAGPHSRPVRVRRVIRENVSKYLKALEEIGYDEVKLCIQCGTTKSNIKRRIKTIACVMCGGEEFVTHRRFKEIPNG